MIHKTYERLPQEKKDRMIRAARKEFIDYPYQKTSINRILDDALIPKGSFYQYFDNKVDLFYLCIYSVYEKLLSARLACGESILSSGVIRMKELGYEKGYELFTQDLTNYLDGEDFALFQNMLQAPPEIRRHVLMNIASELIAPKICTELKGMKNIRKDINYEYYAYLLSMSEVLPPDYGSRKNYTMDQILYLGYQYMAAIYDQITEETENEETENRPPVSHR